jgi:hypothetical protein
MRKFIKTLIIILILTSPLSIHAKADSAVSINDLIENAAKYDGQEVTINGEAIGDRMDRGNDSWINVNDGSNAIGIWLSNSEADKVHYFGDYKYIGDTLKITGTFHRACREHGGEADFHAASLDIIKSGHRVKENISLVKIISTVILLPVALFMLLFYMKKLKLK